MRAKNNSKADEAAILFRACMDSNSNDQEKAFTDMEIIEDLLHIQKAHSLVVKNKRTKTYRSMQQIIEERLGRGVEEHKQIEIYGKV